MWWPLCQNSFCFWDASGVLPTRVVKLLWGLVGLGCVQVCVTLVLYRRLDPRRGAAPLPAARAALGTSPVPVWPCSPHAAALRWQSELNPLLQLGDLRASSPVGEQLCSSFVKLPYFIAENSACSGVSLPDRSGFSARDKQQLACLSKAETRGWCKLVC